MDKPQAGGASQGENESIVFAVSSDGKIVYGGKEIGLDGVRPDGQTLVLGRKRCPVVIQAGQKSHSGVVIRVIDEAKLGGAKDVSLASDQKSERRMRKVYHSEKSPMGLMARGHFRRRRHGDAFRHPSVCASDRQTGAQPRTAQNQTAIDLPPPVEEPEAPPPPEEEKPPEAPPEPQLAETPQQIPLSADLEVAIGSGGALAGFGEIRRSTAAETVQEETFDVSELEKRPEAVSQVAPAYPAELRKAKIEGVVTLVFVLGEDGRVEDPRVENSSRPEFEKPALEAIRKWRFRPGEKDGQAVRTYVRIPMRFRVDSG